MNIREDLKQLKTGPRELRRFGLLVGGVFTALGLWFLWRQRAHYPYFLWPGVVLLALGTARPRALRWVYIGWMSLAFVLGLAMAHVILTLLFFLMITPIGWVARLFGKDFLGLKPNRGAETYWLRRERKPRSAQEYERQF
jgi:hypothetical protein